jgi:hypothetical protein
MVFELSSLHFVLKTKPRSYTWKIECSQKLFDSILSFQNLRRFWWKLQKREVLNSNLVREFNEKSKLSNLFVHPQKFFRTTKSKKKSKKLFRDYFTFSFSHGHCRHTRRPRGPYPPRWTRMASFTPSHLHHDNLKIMKKLLSISARGHRHCLGDGPFQQVPERKKNSFSTRTTSH